MLRWLLCGFLVMAVPGLGAQEGPKPVIKQHFKQAGKAVGAAAVQVGHAVRDGAKATGRFFKRGGKAVGRGARKVGKGFREGGKEVARGVREVPPPPE